MAAPGFRGVEPRVATTAHQAQLRPDVPEELWQVVARLLAKDPSKRFQKPAEVARALVPFIKTDAGSNEKGGAAPVPAVHSPARTDSPCTPT